MDCAKDIEHDYETDLETRKIVNMIKGRLFYDYQFRLVLYFNMVSWFNFDKERYNLVLEKIRAELDEDIHFTVGQIYSNNLATQIIFLIN